MKERDFCNSSPTLTCTIDGVPVEDGETVKITIAPGQVSGKVTSTAGGVRHIIGPTGTLTCTAKDDNGNVAICP